MDESLLADLDQRKLQIEYAHGNNNGGVYLTQLQDEGE